MKKVATLIFSILFISCSSSRLEKKIIDDFFKREFGTDNNIKVLIEEMVPATEALRYYENAYNDRNLYEGEIRFAPSGYPPYNWEIDSVEIGKLKTKCIMDTLIYHWKKSDFINKKLIIISKNYINRPENIKFGYGLYLSKPLITTDKKYAFLFYRSFAVGMGSSDKKVVLLKKINGTWIELNYYYNTKEFN